MFAAYALTEPGARSDAAALSTTYVDDGDHWILNGSKVFISNASISNWMVVFATKDAAIRHQGISCFVIDTDTPGCKTHKMTGKLGQRCADTSEVVFEDCRIPKENRLGGREVNFLRVMNVLDQHRLYVAALDRRWGKSKMSFKIQAEAAFRIWETLWQYRDLRKKGKQARRQ